MTKPPQPRGKDLQKHKLRVLEANTRDFRHVLTACTPLFNPQDWDVIGDDDRAAITLSYDDWAHLLFVMKPFYPHEIAQIEKRFFPNGAAGKTTEALNG